MTKKSDIPQPFVPTNLADQIGNQQDKIKNIVLSIESLKLKFTDFLSKNEIEEKFDEIKEMKTKPTDVGNLIIQVYDKFRELDEANIELEILEEEYANESISKGDLCMELKNVKIELQRFRDIERGKYNYSAIQELDMTVMNGKSPMPKIPFPELYRSERQHNEKLIFKFFSNNHGITSFGSFGENCIEMIYLTNYGRFFCCIYHPTMQYGNPLKKYAKEEYIEYNFWIPVDKIELLYILSPNTNLHDKSVYTYIKKFLSYISRPE